MALTVVPEKKPKRRKSDNPDIFIPPTPVITTPCDPWPRPYSLEKGLRKVLPYHYTYNTSCKQRWRGKELLQIFRSEFRDRPVEYYVCASPSSSPSPSSRFPPLLFPPLTQLTRLPQQNAILAGKVTVNGQPATPNTIIQNGQIISHTLHRHEPPVTADPIGILHEDNDMIVINKPAGVPVHPAGRYNYNSVMEIMRADRGMAWIPHPCNRLDRLTSGIMFVGKHPRAAEEMGVQLMTRTVKKEYVARVIGEFPEREVVVDQPILQISPKLGLNRVRAEGKEARTVFRRLAYYPAKPRERMGAVEGEEEDGRSEKERAREAKMAWKGKEGYSIVRCLPLTGRTHQLRVHLQFLGHPIANDPIYCNQRVFGADLGVGDASGDKDDDIITRLSRMGKDEVAEAVAYHDEMVEEYEKKKAEKMTGELCDLCQAPLYSDPGVHELGIYLHAKRYECAEGKWAYETELPKWALPPEGREGPKETTKETDPLALAEKIEKLAIEEIGPVLQNGQEKEALVSSG
ncbi:hypothetical protein MMC10_009238 [Thelotrema lepadinum]|nr:hypothetical protein [Thelotrema lepadinum]